MEGGAAGSLPWGTLLVRHDEDLCVKRGFLGPCLLAETEHALAHDARSGAFKGLLQNIVVAPFLAALTQPKILPKEPLWEHPRCSFIHCAVQAGSPIRPAGAMNSSSDMACPSPKNDSLRHVGPSRTATIRASNW